MPWMLFLVATEEKVIKTKYTDPKLSLLQSAYTSFRSIAAQSFPFLFFMIVLIVILEFIGTNRAEESRMETIAFECISAFGNIGITIGKLVGFRI